MRELYARRLVATDEDLVGSFKVVAVDIGSIELHDASQVVRRIEQLAFILETFVIAFNEGVLIRSLRWADLWVDP